MGSELLEHLPEKIARFYESRGITSLFPPQREALRKGIFSEKNFVISVPTAGGKTLIAEFAMLYEIMKGGKCLYVVPLRALASEKFNEFRKFSELGFKVGLSTGDYESRDEWLGNYDIIITTGEKADSLMRNRASWMKYISCLVVDEVHLIDSPDRGPTLEMVIVKLKKLNPDLRIVALSATIANVEELAEWLNAEVMKSSWRPVKLYEGVSSGKKLILVKDGMFVERETAGTLEGLVRETLEENGQVLVFDGTRKRAEATARKLSVFFESSEELRLISSRIRELDSTDTGRKLADCVEKGTAFHHAGLIYEERSIVEKAFREGLIRVVVSTPTLAAGVNLPARRVIIKSYRRYRMNEGSVPIPCLEYKQMAGRAGRPGLDPFGEAIILAKSAREAEDLIWRYILAEPEPVYSKLGSEKNLRFHVLSLIAENPLRIDELENSFRETFFFSQNGDIPGFESILSQLGEWGMIEGSEILQATYFGEVVSKLYIDPMSGFIFRKSIEKMDDGDDLQLLHLICRVPDMEKLYINRRDYWIEEIAGETENLTYKPPVNSPEYEWFLSEFKTALCLLDWIDEEDESIICDKYSIAPGDLRRIVEIGEWLAHSLSKIAHIMENPVEKRAEKLVERLHHGVREELLSLVRFRGIGRIRARKMYSRGIRTARDILIKRDDLRAILGDGIAEKVLSQIREED